MENPLVYGGGSCYIDAPAVVQQRRETAAVVDPGVFSIPGSFHSSTAGGVFIRGTLYWRPMGLPLAASGLPWLFFSATSLQLKKRQKI